MPMSYMCEIYHNLRDNMLDYFHMTIFFIVILNKVKINTNLTPQKIYFYIIVHNKFTTYVFLETSI